jgi:hypothetical protein
VGHNLATQLRHLASKHCGLENREANRRGRKLRLGQGDLTTVTGYIRGHNSVTVPFKEELTHERVFVCDRMRKA